MSYDYASGYYATAPPADQAYAQPYAPPAGAPPAQAWGPPAAHPAYGAPPPAYAHYPPANMYAMPPSDEVRTIFITGFPQDVKERELNNMLRFMPGYEASQMTWKNDLAQGFALFATAALARAACDQITQLIFDESSTLRCEMARKNMYIKDADAGGKRARTGPGSFTGASTYGAPPAYRPPAHPSSHPSAASGGPASGVGGDNPPCNTLFIGNLSETVNEEELNAVFAHAQGFRQLKVVRGRNTTAFVEFDTVENATASHAAQQATVLASSADRGTIRVQFSRNPFGKKRDVTGGMIDTPVPRAPEYGGV